MGSSRPPFFAPFADRRRASRPLALLASSLGLLLAAAGSAAAQPEPGALTQLEDEDACTAHPTSDAPCAVGWALQDPTGLAITKNGRHLYVASTGSDSVAILKRAAATGALTQPEAPAQSCVSATGTGGLCTAVSDLAGPVAVAISPDSKFVYVATHLSSVSPPVSRILVFARHLVTGALTRLSGNGGTDGCVAEAGTASCADGVALDRAFSLAISPDGKHLYAAAENSHAVAVFARNKTTGVLTQLAGTSACVSDDGTSGACADGRALREARWVSVSPDGKHVYVAAESSNAVAVLARNRTTGALTQFAGTRGCVSATGHAGTCGEARALSQPVALAVSPDNKHVYVASLGSGAVAVFVRNRSTGELTQLEDEAGCVSQSGSDGCATGSGLAGARSVTVSQDGKHVYVVAQSGNAVAVFARNRTTGALTQLDEPDGCTAEDGDAACNEGVGLKGARAVVVSKDGKHVYVGSFQSDAVAAFKRKK